MPERPYGRGATHSLRLANAALPAPEILYCSLNVCVPGVLVITTGAATSGYLTIVKVSDCGAERLPWVLVAVIWSV